MRVGDFEIIRDDHCWLLRHFGPSKKHGERVKGVTYHGSLKQVADAMAEIEAVTAFLDAIDLDAWKKLLTARLEGLSESLERRPRQRKLKAAVAAQP